ARNEQAFCLDVLGEICLSQHLCDKAINTCNSSYALFQAEQNVGGMGASALHKGNAYYMKVMDDSAKKYYSIAIGHFTRQKDTTGVAICYSNLSRIFLEAGNNGAAINYARMALNCVTRGNYNIRTSTLQHLGDIYAAMGQNEKAVSCVN